MIRKKIIFFLLFMASCTLFGQSSINLIKSLEENNFLENENITGRHFIFAEGAALVSSSSIRSSMLNPIIFGGNITENTKLDNYQHLTNSNIAGFHLQSGITTAHRVDELFGKNSMIFIGLGYRNFLETKFSGDVFKLLFSGNTQFVDKELDLKNQQFQSYTYSDIKIGFVRKKVDENLKRKRIYGFSLGYIKSFSHFNVNICSGTFFTAPETYQMSLQSNYDIARSDTNQFVFSGQGGYLNLFYGFDIEKVFSFKLSIEDIGFINWKNGLKSEKMVQHEFSGIDINDITHIEESTSGLDNLADSLQNSLMYPNTITSYYTVLPANAAISMQYQIIEQIGIESYIRIFTNSIRKFECMGIVHIYPIKKYFRISPFIYNSGYGTWTPGMELAVFNLKHIYFKAGIYSFEFNKSTYGGYTSFGFKL